MKKVYNVSYDLNKSGKDYTGLHTELKTYECYHLLDSTWLVCTTHTAGQIWERLKAHIDKDDNILIIQIVNNKSGWLPTMAWNWLDTRLSNVVA